MKQTLSAEQSATLIAKGISADKASMCQLYSDYDGEIIDPSEVFEDCGKLLAVVNDEAIEVDCNIISKDSDFDHSFADDMPIFTLADLLGLLPFKIHSGKYEYWLDIAPMDYGKQWSIGYYCTEKPRVIKGLTHTDSLIECAVQEIEWLTENNYKLNEQ